MADPLIKTSATAPIKGPAAPTSAPVEAQGSLDDLQIHSIPEKFYGAALKARISEVQRPDPSNPANADDASKKRGWLVPVIVGGVLLLGIGSGFAYFNRALLFPPPAPAPIVTPEPEPEPVRTPPEAPTNVSASATMPTLVRLTWTDVATTEAKYRVERRESATSYVTIRNLAPNESSYEDPTVEADKDYLYRIIAVNDDGEGVSTEVAARTPALPPPPAEPAKLPPAGLDSDSDGLTDLEEPLYGSPIRDPDADKDSFLDGNEVFHLYSPSGKAPGRLLESGLVKPLESSVGWRIYIPASWQSTMGPDGMKGSVATGHGEMFSISVEDNSERRPILDWYLARNPGVLSSQVANIQTKSGFEGLEGADLLTTYFPWGDRVLVFRYDLSNHPFVNYRTTYEMMKNSLSLTALPNMGTSAPAVPAETAPAAPQPVNTEPPAPPEAAPPTEFTPPASATPEDPSPTPPPPPDVEAPAADPNPLPPLEEDEP